ncbi:PDZ domain-containing protein [Caenorhabditis elegans]|uniref:PDZ domain-containing protein n=1 Tax=Caenorhabditis elegans TaxID=6239 RepID=O18301_CAEEL|nr:PDZ domain-containing protein [Caenorhabditis elegans]CAB05025.1 PDZ domain-containing protein [Caenorhabditis elegans]|eukprot:NP_493476.1 Uncharacterized protein CELE_ZK849.1 [Caenorhabditis elegans]
MSKALASDEKDDWITHLKAISNVFTQVCTLSASEESAKKLAIKEREECLQELVELRAIAEAHDDVIQQFHLLLAANHQGDATSRQIFNDMKQEVGDNMERIQEHRLVEAKLNVEKRRNERMAKHINEVSKKSVMHLMATRFYARELAAMRQMMDLVRNAATIESAVKSKLWDEIEKENRLLRLNTLWLINRINSSDLGDAAFENGDDWQSSPRLVILMREHINQGLGLEITGGCDQFRPVVVTGKLKRSMADDDQLRVNDRILAIDGTFVTNTTTHAEVMEMLENESAKDFISLIVSQFDPTKYHEAHPNGKCHKFVSTPISGKADSGEDV